MHFLSNVAWDRSLNKRTPKRTIVFVFTRSREEIVTTGAIVFRELRVVVKETCDFRTTIAVRCDRVGVGADS